ncbi:DNA polymerase III subunit alpha [Evansella sp. AB-P1]|uniref:DNA polymerase III subunit alpha n=1 Tax=Evansella sp. AB-P1 TaxID=3037653 RepID=UPI0024203E71|nr:DNA polymerase III subunit alpha [Evansella sp. AB-P1]MDG5786986.1 DNA polymerase III subunit alpha [Evansella sp. AB-P1]
MSFVHLHVHSEFSLLHSSAKIKELVFKAHELGFHSLALTDKDAMYGVIPFYKECMKYNIKPIVGVELAYAEEDQDVTEKHSHRILLLAKNNKGYQSLLRLTTKAHENASRFGPFITKSDLTKESQGVLVILPFEEGIVQHLIESGQFEQAYDRYKWFQSFFGKEDVYIEIQNHWRPREREKLLKIVNWVKDMKKHIRVVASNHVHFTERHQENAHRVIQSIRLGIKLDDLKESYSSSEYYLKTEEDMLSLFPQWKDACKETEKIASRCSVNIDFGRFVLPKYPLPERMTAKEYLRELCYKAISDRFSEPTNDVFERLNYELGIISEMNYDDYFLIVADFMRFAHENRIMTGPGRGSAAGSLVAYLLKITNVDPLQYGLLFERFLNPERITMPDIDIDFPDNRRDEVIHYVKEKYGKYHVAQIITFGTLAAKAAIRDAGRVLGLEVPLIDKVVKQIPSRPTITLDEVMKESLTISELIMKDEKIKELFKIAMDIEGLPRHSSIHAAGIVMSDRPLMDFVPLQMGNDGLYLTQYPMGDLEDIGLLKMDFLGLRNLSFIDKTLELIRIHQGKKINLETISLEDQATFQLLSNGDTNGVFQLESSGMKSTLKRLKPTEFEDIVAVNALYRPGPMENIPVYIRRKHGEEPVDYPHENLKNILYPTYGVLIYQEQIMQIASKMAGFTLGEADILRRAVGKKKREVLEKARHQFIEGAIKEEYSTDEANKMYNTIVRFANYGFNRSHAVAYSMIAYYLAYLKANFPLEFLTAMMGSVEHHHDKLGEYVAEARRRGIKVHPPSIMNSEVQFTVKDDEIWMGLATVKNVGVQAVKEIIKERRLKKFTDLFDICARISQKILPKRSLDALIAAGALDELCTERAKLLASVEIALEYGDKYREQQLNYQTELFFEEAKKPGYIDVPPLSNKDRLNFEKQVLGFYVSAHPIEFERHLVEQYNPISITLLKENNDQNELVRVCGMIEDVKVIQTKKKKQMAFLKLSDESGEVDVTVFPDAFQLYRTKLQKSELIFIEGKVQEHQGEKKLILEKCTTISSLKRKMYEKNKPVLYLKISLVHEKQTVLNKLKVLLEDHPGEISVILVYERTNKAKHLSEMWNVSGEERLILRLTELLGQKNVYLKDKDQR